MKIKADIIKQVNTVSARRNIGTKLDISDQTLYKLLARNAANGRLTKLDALTAIKEETGAKDIMELVDDSLVAA